MVKIDYSELLPALGKILKHCFVGKRYKLINVEWHPMQECQAYTLAVVTADDQITREFHATFTNHEITAGSLLLLLERFKAQIEYFWESRYKMINKLLGQDSNVCEFFPKPCEETGSICHAGFEIRSTIYYQDKDEWHQYTCSKEYSKDCPWAKEQRKEIAMNNQLKRVYKKAVRDLCRKSI